jgi:hypothetical protein
MFIEQLNPIMEPDMKETYDYSFPGGSHLGTNHFPITLAEFPDVALRLGPVG